MTSETARILGQALKERWATEAILISLLKTDPPIEGLDELLAQLGETYVHEQRIINRIISEARDA